MESAAQDVLVVLDIEGLDDRNAMETHLRREGLRVIEGEDFAYLGSTTTAKINTLLYVLDGVKKAIRKGGFLRCTMMVSIGEYPIESYRYDRDTEDFILL